MSIGTQAAFPIPDGSEPGEDGMTYRQWLAGMALANLAGTNTPDKVGRACVDFADAVVNNLEQPKP